VKTIEKAPEGAARGLALIFHGRGASKEDLADVGELLAKDGWHSVLPDAPMPWGPGGGFCWYESDTREKDLPASRALVAALAREKQKALGLGREQTIVMGFSQGGVLSLDVALNEGVAVRVGCLSGYLSVPEAPATPKEPVRVFMAHGTSDFLIRVSVARKSRRLLEDMGVPVEYHEYEMAHDVISEELEDLRKWLAT
jgi:phospholipase/carboxylesterase